MFLMIKCKLIIINYSGGRTDKWMDVGIHNREKNIQLNKKQHVNASLFLSLSNRYIFLIVLPVTVVDGCFVVVLVVVAL